MDPLLIGVLVLLAVAAATVLVVRRRGRGRSDVPSPPSKPERSMIGKVLGGHRLVETLGGGMGAVYRGEPLDGGGPPVAVKVLKRELSVNPLFQSRFEREALVGADLRQARLDDSLTRQEERRRAGEEASP